MATYKQNWWLGIILITIGLVLYNSVMGADASLGLVLMAVGGLFLLLGMFRWQKQRGG